MAPEGVGAVARCAGSKRSPGRRRLTAARRAKDATLAGAAYSCIDARRRPNDPEADSCSPSTRAPRARAASSSMPPAASSRWRSASSAQIYPAARLGRARPDGDLAHAARDRAARRSPRPASARRRHRRASASPTSARPRCVWNRAHRRAGRTTPSSGRTGAPSRPAPRCASAGLEGAVPRAHRPRHRRLFLRHQAAAGSSTTWPGRARAAERGELAFGTVDSWLIWQLTGGAADSAAQAVHATDVTNASRTLLFDIRTQRRGTTSCCGCCDIPRALLPRGAAVEPCLRHDRGPSCSVPRLPIAGIAGDQQAALFGQACFTPGLAKNTYGTGCFMLMNTGARRPATSANGLITTSAAQTRRGAPQYALEGSVFIGGAVVQWLRDGLQAIKAQRRGAGARRERARQRRRDVRAGLHRPRRAVLGPRRARHDRRPHARHHAWRTSRAPRSRASRSRARRCCRR